MTAFYEGRIEKAGSVQDMKGIAEEMQSYIGENERVLGKRAETAAAEAGASTLIKGITIGSAIVAVTAIVIAATVLTGGIALLVAEGIAGMGTIFTVAGASEWIREEGVDKFKALAREENAALTDLLGKVAKKSPEALQSSTLSNQNNLGDSFKKEADKNLDTGNNNPTGSAIKPEL
jgi:hypothetical protein